MAGERQGEGLSPYVALFADRLKRALAKRMDPSITEAQGRLADKGAYSSYMDLVKLGQQGMAMQIRDAYKEASFVPSSQLKKQ